MVVPGWILFTPPRDETSSSQSSPDIGGRSTEKVHSRKKRYLEPFERPPTPEFFKIKPEYLKDDGSIISDSDSDVSKNNQKREPDRDHVPHKNQGHGNRMQLAAPKKEDADAVKACVVVACGDGLGSGNGPEHGSSSGAGCRPGPFHCNQRCSCRGAHGCCGRKVFCDNCRCLCCCCHFHSCRGGLQESQGHLPPAKRTKTAKVAVKVNIQIG